ncbi:MAG: HNH endonuclease family protein, partial [Terriglobia bacterium]
RVTATLYYGPGQGKPQPPSESLEKLRGECTSPQTPAQISSRLLKVSQKLTSLYKTAQWNAVVDILQARILAVALMLAEGVDDAERKRLLDQWERVTFRIFGLAQKDSRTKVGDYIRFAYNIATNQIDTRTYNQILRLLAKLGSDYPAGLWANTEVLQFRNWYDSPEDCRHLLWNYEEHLATLHGGGATVDEQERSKIWKMSAWDSIEHIFPQNPAGQQGWTGKMRGRDGFDQPLERNVGRIGNLLLLPERLNGEARNFPFATKRNTYGKHHLRMVEEVCREPDWTLVQIEERERRIADWAKDRWADL